MAAIKVNIQNIVGLIPICINYRQNVYGIRVSINSILNQIDGRVANRNNIGERLRSIESSLSEVETRISRIRNTMDNGVNSYNNTEMYVRNMGKNILGINGVQGSTVSPIMITSLDVAKQVTDKVEIENQDNTDSLFEQILKDDWSIKGSVINGIATKSGKIIGIDSSGTIEGDVLGGSIKTKTTSKIDPKKGNVNIQKSIEAEGHLAQGSATGNIGLLGGEVKGTVGSISATGSVGISLYKNKKFSPALEAKLKAEAVAAKGEAKANFGTKEYDVHVKADGEVFGAKAEASGGVGVITYKDELTGNTKQSFGVQGKAGAEAYVTQGKVSGGITIFGIIIDVGITGKAGGAGVSAEGRLTTSGCKGSIGAGLGLGAGLEISIDWSKFSLW